MKKLLIFAAIVALFLYLKKYFSFEAFISKIKDFEGFSPVAYWDVNAYRYGHGTPAPSKDATIDKIQADLKLREFISNIENDIDSSLPAPLRYALIDLQFNSGPLSSKLKVLLKDYQKNLSKIKDYILSINTSKGVPVASLTKRREYFVSQI